jgi:hypothetical protein
VRHPDDLPCPSVATSGSATASILATLPRLSEANLQALASYAAFLVTKSDEEPSV